ncbi:unnamed protein product [Lactuca saligna]|uniref:DC-UbP/UBTD2 N-terminal domain-containing protein n=1 Tax=Lactuca saligna TaxID=75948 RepID=A0AA35ZIN5_LACSI|nr:unnamed protein product [Lactuca saligna]
MGVRVRLGKSGHLKSEARCRECEEPETINRICNRNDSAFTRINPDFTSILPAIEDSEERSFIMGCVKSSAYDDAGLAHFNRVRKPRPWNHDADITLEQLRDMRNVFWRNIPRFGGQLEIWQALRRAAESDLPYAQAIIDENRIRLVNRDMSICYDELNIRYELPLYVLSEPENLLDRPRPDRVRRPSMMDRLRRQA